MDSKFYLIQAVNLKVLEKTFVQILRFSQQSFWGFRPSGIWGFVTGRLVASIWKEWHSLLLQMTESSLNLNLNLNLHFNLDEDIWFSLSEMCCYNLTFFTCFDVFMFLFYWKFSCAGYSFTDLIWRVLLVMHSHIHWCLLQAVSQQ